MRLLIADTCFWIDLFMIRETHHEFCYTFYSKNILNTKFIFPWPCMYETLRTSFVRDYNAVKRLEKELQNENLIKYGEKNIRNLALLEMFKFNLKYGLSLSLTDCIIREIIKSGRSNIKGLLTSNKKDFIDVCQSCKVEILDFS